MGEAGDTEDRPESLAGRMRWGLIARDRRNTRWVMDALLLNIEGETLRCSLKPSIGRLFWYQKSNPRPIICFVFGVQATNISALSAFLADL